MHGRYTWGESRLTDICEAHSGELSIADGGQAGFAGLHNHREEQHQHKHKACNGQILQLQCHTLSCFSHLERVLN